MEQIFYKPEALSFLQSTVSKHQWNEVMRCSTVHTPHNICYKNNKSRLAANCSPNSHKCSECATTLYHWFANCIQKLTPTETISRKIIQQKHQRTHITTYTKDKKCLCCNWSQLGLLLQRDHTSAIMSQLFGRTEGTVDHVKIFLLFTMPPPHRAEALIDADVWRLSVCRIHRA